MRKDDILDDRGKPAKLTIELLTDHAFSRAFDDTSKTHATKLYQSVQTCLKSKRGIGEPFIVKFYAPLNIDSPEEPIKYDYNKIGADDVALI